MPQDPPVSLTQSMPLTACQLGTAAMVVCFAMAFQNNFLVAREHGSVAPAVAWDIGSILHVALLLSCIVLVLVYVGLSVCGTKGAASLLFCAGVPGGQAAALMVRGLSSTECLRATIDTLRNTGAPTAPPFGLVAVAFLVLGASLGFQPIPLRRRLHVALSELTVFALNLIVVYLRLGELDVVTAWASHHVCSFVLGLLLSLLTTGELSHHRRGSLGVAPCGRQAAEVDPAPASREQVDALLAVLIALMVFPLAQQAVAFETKLGPMVYWLSPLV